jgi:serine/threonine kinase PknH
MSDTQGSRVGTTFGPYHLKRLLGRGGMGEVYEAEHTVKEWTVAVKVMTAEFSKDAVFRERMKREARIAGRLQEPHVVPIHDYGEIDGQLFLEMRLIEGTDLDSVLKRFGPLTPARAVAIISQVASALDAAHAAGVMHRDVKPPNILITRDDFAYLVDFGIASATTDEKLTQLGTAVGTWKYMAPERFSTDEVTYRADIYALACVLYECLTGAPPYRSDSASMLVTSHLMDPIPQASTKRTGIPRGLDAVIARGMAKKPEDRYASAGDLALAAHEALSNPDQDHADNILRRSEQATLPPPPTTAAPHGMAPPPPTMAATGVAPPPRHGGFTPPPTPVQQPPYQGPGVSGSGPRPTGQPSWAQSSGPVPTAHTPPPSGQYHQTGSNWGGPPLGQPPTQQFGGPAPGQPPTQQFGGPAPGQPPTQQFGGQAPWGQAQQPPAKRRSPWPIIASVAAVLIVIVGGLGIWLATKPKPKPPPPPLTSDRLAPLLLSVSEINSIMGATNMTAGSPMTDLGKSTLTLSSPECLGVLYAIQNDTYTGSGWSDVQGLVLSEPGDSFDHWAHQAVVRYPTADKANDFMQTSLGKWKSCAGKTVTVTNAKKTETYRWTLSELEGQPPRISMTKAQEAAKGWSCQRVLSVTNNVIIDVNACSYKLNGQAAQISDKIIAKITE